MRVVAGTTDIKAIKRCQYGPVAGGSQAIANEPIRKLSPLPSQFESIGQGRSAWCRKAELSLRSCVEERMIWAQGRPGHVGHCAADGTEAPSRELKSFLTS